MPDPAAPAPAPDDHGELAALREHHRTFGRLLNGLSWRLLAAPARTADDDERLLGAAHASLFHWTEAGGPPRTRGEWLVAHVYTVLGRAEPAMHHARRALALAEAEPDVRDFDVAYAYEAMARAHALAGHAGEARRWHGRAAAAGAAIADGEDRDIFLGDFHAGPWYGLDAMP
jgi:hypothetical protein